MSYEYPLCPFISHVHPEKRDELYSYEYNGYNWFEKFGSKYCQGLVCKFWDPIENQCRFWLIDGIARHVHLSHKHPKRHLCEDRFIVYPCGSSTFKSSMSALLLAEFGSNQDLDGDGKVYGYDFKINIEDPEISLMLASVETHPNCVATKILFWEEYLDTLIYLYYLRKNLRLVSQTSDEVKLHIDCYVSTILTSSCIVGKMDVEIVFKSIINGKGQPFRIDMGIEKLFESIIDSVSQLSNIGVSVERLVKSIIDGISQLSNIDLDIS